MNPRQSLPVSLKTVPKTTTIGFVEVVKSVENQKSYLDVQRAIERASVTKIIHR